MKLITMLIQLAPIGVFCLMAEMFSNVGWRRSISSSPIS